MVQLDTRSEYFGIGIHRHQNDGFGYWKLDVLRPDLL
jgi:hypothetical protein